MKTIQCVSCGFLAKHCPGGNVPTPKFFEMDEHDRLTGKAFTHTFDTLAGAREAYPVCFRKVPEAKAELEVFKDARKRDKDALLPIMTRERTCSKWYRYEPGLSPQEHLQEVKTQELELSNRRFQIMVTVVLGIFALAEVFATLIQVAYPTGWPWLMGLMNNAPNSYPPL